MKQNCQETSIFMLQPFDIYYFKFLNGKGNHL